MAIPCLAFWGTTSCFSWWLPHCTQSSTLWVFHFPRVLTDPCYCQWLLFILYSGFNSHPGGYDCPANLWLSIRRPTLVVLHIAWLVKPTLSCFSYHLLEGWRTVDGCRLTPMGTWLFAVQFGSCGIQSAWTSLNFNFCIPKDKIPLSHGRREAVQGELRWREDTSRSLT